MSSTGRRRTKHEEHEEHVNHERWLVTYADMLTLLMVLFIVMFAMSQVDQKKYSALKNGLAEGFGNSSTFMKGSDSILEGQEANLIPDLGNNEMFAQLPKDQQQLVVQVIDSQNERTAQASSGAAKAETSRLSRIRDEIEAELRKRGLGDDVQATIDERGLVVSLVSRHVVFESNVAALSARGQLVVDTLAPVLRDLPDPLRIDGHTNQASGNPKYYATDWDLSAARAVTVLRRLSEVDGVPAARMSVSAFGHQRPLLDPDEPGSQQVNKRVDIVVLPRVPLDATKTSTESPDEKSTQPTDEVAPGHSTSAEGVADHG